MLATAIRRWVVGTAVVGLLVATGTVTATPMAVAASGTASVTASSASSPGYWLVSSDGGVFPFHAPFAGSTGGVHLNQPVVGMASTQDGGGYWLVARDGGVFPFGDAKFYGSTGSVHLNQPIVGMAADPATGGYWLVASDGGVFPFHAGYFGSTGSVHLNQPVVGMASTPDGGGYWLVARDGGVFPFGDAHFYGSTGGVHLNQPIVAMAADAVSGGYWLVASDGGVFEFHAPFYGSAGGVHLNQPVVGMAPAPRSNGYWLVGSDGGVYYYGHAPFYGSTGGVHLNAPIVGMAAQGGPPSLITLGNVGTYSGVFGSVYAGVPKALAAWADYINTVGGLAGHPVRVISADDGGNSATNLSLVENMVTKDHVLAFVGNMDPLTVAASLSYLDQHRIPVVGGDQLSDNWWSNSMLFPVGTQLEADADANVKVDVAIGDTNLAILSCLEVSFCSTVETYLVADGHAAADGASVVDHASYSLTQPNLTAECLNAEAASANVILLLGDPSSLERLASSCTGIGYHPRYDAWSTAINGSETTDNQLGQLVSALPTFPWPAFNTPAQTAYQQAVRAYAPGLTGSPATSTAWTAGFVLAFASGDLGNQATTAELLQGLATIKHNAIGDLAPPLTFNSNGPATPATCYFTTALVSGAFVVGNHGQPTC